MFFFLHPKEKWLAFTKQYLPPPPQEFYNNSSYHNRVTKSLQVTKWGVDKLFGTGMTDEGWWLQLQEYLLRLSTKKQGLDTSGGRGWGLGAAGDFWGVLLVAVLGGSFCGRSEGLRSRKYMSALCSGFLNEFCILKKCRMLDWSNSAKNDTWYGVHVPCTMYNRHLNVSTVHQWYQIDFASGQKHPETWTLSPLRTW